MNKPAQFLLATSMVLILAGCGATAKEIKRMSLSERSDIFTEVVPEGPIPTGYADLVIRASLKTPLSSYYPLESKRSGQEREFYPFLVNIDGQAVLWQVQGQKHDLPAYVDDKTSHDPEAGIGMRYVLEKKIRLAAGRHRVFFGLPDELYDMTVDITLGNGGLYALEFTPDYNYKTLPTRIPTYLKGLHNYGVVFKESKEK